MPTRNANGQAFRAVRDRVNIGIAVDVEGKDGARSLKVPEHQGCRLAELRPVRRSLRRHRVARSRTTSSAMQDFEGTTISLTNPGTVGTVGSVPRLMPGQGAIIATGTIDYPAEYHGATEQLRALLGLSKVMTVTCTYDHRVIQGAESGMFLGRLQALLQGAGQVLRRDLRRPASIPHKPVHWEPDRPVSIPGVRGAQLDEVAKEAAVLQLINAYRVRGHLIADFDPLGSEAVYHPELDPATYGLTIWDLDREFLTGTLDVGRRRASEGRHPARDSGNAAPDLLRKDRMRVHEHPDPGAEALAAAPHGANRESLAARSRQPGRARWNV